MNVRILFHAVAAALIAANIDIFKPEPPRTVGAHLMAGVGDMANWNQAGAICAVKGHERGRDISVIAAPYTTKIHDEVLGNSGRSATGCSRCPETGSNPQRIPPYAWA